MDDYIMKFDKCGIEFITWWEYVNQVNSEFISTKDIDKLRRKLNFVFYMIYILNDTTYTPFQHKYIDIFIAYKRWKLVDGDVYIGMRNKKL